MAISIKTAQEIEIMRRSGRILASVLSHIIEIAKPGVTTMELDQEAERMIREAGGTPAFKGYSGFPSTLCTSTNNEVVHTFPSDRELKDGDIITVDCGVDLKGFKTDSAVTILVGEVPKETKRFVEVTRSTLYGAIDLVKPGVRIGEIGHYIDTQIKSAGYHIIKELIGHGIGRELHEDPQIPNFGKPSKGAVLKPGMTICIEPIVGYSSRLIDTLPDGWTILTRDGGLACQEEHTILVTDTGYEILTSRE